MKLDLPPTTTKFDRITLQGGLDLLTPTLQVAPGVAREALNWEQSITGGYSTLMGYERMDGRASPSAAVYLTITVTGTVSVGSTITGGTSGATGVVLSVTDGVVAYTKSTGTFLVGESIGSAAITSLGGVVTDPTYSAQQSALAADVYRADIQAVPGSGPTRGVAFLGGVLYAWRDNVGATAMAIYKATLSGWTLVPLLYEIAFTLGSAEYAEGSTLSRGGVTATVRRSVLETGDWLAGTAAGRLIVTAPSGTFTAGVAGGGGVATLSGNATAITLLPGGRVETDLGNFKGSTRLYCADGVNRAYEFDGTYLVPLNTGNTPDTPAHVRTHQNHLFIGLGTFIQHSGIGEPYKWSVISGGAIYRTEGTVNSFTRLPGNQTAGALAVGCSDSTRILYGTSAANFQLSSFEDSVGGKPYSSQNVGGQTLFFGDAGVFSLATSQNYGNFSTSSLTLNIRPFTQQRRNLLTASLISKEKSQYRIYFADGSGLYMTVINGQLVGALPVQFPNPVRCACQGETPDGTETSFFGSDNGYVYRLETGTSFDGAAIDHYLTLPFNAQGNSRQVKRYRKASFEVQGSAYAEFRMTYEIGYGSPDIPQASDPQAMSVALASTYWDQFTWDSFVWDGRALAPSEVTLEGSAENIAIRLEGSSSIFPPVTVNSIVLHYTPRRFLR